MLISHKYIVIIIGSFSNSNFFLPPIVFLDLPSHLVTTLQSVTSINLNTICYFQLRRVECCVLFTMQLRSYLCFQNTQDKPTRQIISKTHKLSHFNKPNQIVSQNKTTGNICYNIATNGIITDMSQYCNKSQHICHNITS